MGEQSQSDLASRKKFRSQRHMSDLDDGCLLHILRRLTPLPDLFSIAATCKRFKQLTNDARLSVLVTQHKTQEQRLNIGRRVLPTLQDAVHASRAGDTIVLEAGQAHNARDVVIPWPLKLIGSGAAAEDTLLLCPKGPEAALDFRSTGKVANLTIQATLSNCILHRRGRVTVEACKLQCHAGGLEHLFTPLVTLAAADLRKHKQPRSARTGIEAGMGVLSVIETKIRGGTGATAVKCGGTGALQSVRVIHLSRDTLFWFDVHADKPGLLGGVIAPNNTATHPVIPPQTSTKFEEGVAQPVSLGHTATLSSQNPTASQGACAQNQEDVVLMQRVKAWNATHHPVDVVAQ